MWFRALLAGAVLCLDAGGAGAMRVPRIPCPAGEFVLDASGAAAVENLFGSPAPVLDIDPTGTVRLAGCEAPGRIRAKKRFTKVRAKWAPCGAAPKARLVAKIATSDCATMSGTVRARRIGKATFTATRLGGPTTTSLPGGSTTSTTTSGGTTTSITIPEVCGNGVRDGTDECEGVDGCGPEQRCTASCTCQDVAPSPSTSQTLIAAARRAGLIDYPTSLVYRAWALFADSRLPPEYDGEAWQSEDTSLFVEMAGAWNNLEPATQDLLRPFTLRPDEVGSYWDPGPPSFPAARAAAQEDVECPYQPGAPLPDWRSTPTTHFVIWSCGGGDPGQDPYAAQRVIVAGVAETVWNTMTPESGVPKADQYPPPGDGRIDVYLVVPHLCKTRDGACTAIPLDEEGAPALGAVAATAPCDATGGAAATASSFMLLDVSTVAAQAPDGTWPLRFTFAHEFFHIMQNTWNYEGRGGTCDGMRPASDFVESWLVETWAEWAAGAYFPNDWRAEREREFREYQATRDGASVSLRRDDPEPYDAFVYPLFVQQEKGSRAAALSVWKSSGAVRKPSQFDERANADLPFADHFRDFAVRNFNATSLPGNPVAPRYQQLDTAIPPDVKPIIVEPGVVLDVPVQRRPLVSLMQPLSAEYRHFEVDDKVSYVAIDVSSLKNSAFVHADALVNVGGQWSRRRPAGPVLAFCRDDAADDIKEFYLILSNDGYVDGSEVSGHYEVTTSFDCPAGWSGTIDYVETNDTHEEFADADRWYVTDTHLGEEQHWTVAGSVRILEPVPHDELTLDWHATGSVASTHQEGDPFCAFKENVTAGSGSAGGTDRLGANPVGNDVYLFGVLEVDPDTAITGTSQFVDTTCGGRLEYGEPATFGYNALTTVFGQTPNLQMATPTQDDPKHYQGEYTIFHFEAPRVGGMWISDGTVRWDLHHR